MEQILEEDRLNNDLLKIRIYEESNPIGTVEVRNYNLLEFSSVNINPNKIISFNIIQIGGSIDYDHSANLFISNNRKYLYLYISKAQERVTIHYTILYYE